MCCDLHSQRLFIVNEAEVNVFLQVSSFFYDPTDVGDLISGSSAFSKSSWNIWNFSVHVLLKPGVENFEHYFASMWDNCNCVVVRTFSGIAFMWNNPGEGEDYPLQYSALENSMDFIVHRVANVGHKSASFHSHRWNWNENWLFESFGHCWIFQICWHSVCSTFTASSFRTWDSSASIPLHVLAFLIVTCLQTPGYLAPGEWSHHHGYLSH